MLEFLAGNAGSRIVHFRSLILRMPHPVPAHSPEKGTSLKPHSSALHINPALHYKSGGCTKSRQRHVSNRVLRPLTKVTIQRTWKGSRVPQLWVRALCPPRRTKTAHPSSADTLSWVTPSNLPRTAERYSNGSTPNGCESPQLVADRNQFYLIFHK